MGVTYVETNGTTLFFVGRPSTQASAEAAADGSASTLYAPVPVVSQKQSIAGFRQRVYTFRSDGHQPGGDDAFFYILLFRFFVIQTSHKTYDLAYVSIRRSPRAVQ